MRGTAFGSGFAGLFEGTVSITGDLNVAGTITKGGGGFRIDHPLDPTHKYLFHSFVESPDMMNIYNGNVTTDENGLAVIVLPSYFEALNGDFRYQLTVVGVFAQAIVASKVKGNQFSIRTNQPNVEVSWQVTGVRKDAYAEKHRIVVEEAKSEKASARLAEYDDAREKLGAGLAAKPAPLSPTAAASWAAIPFPSSSQPDNNNPTSQPWKCSGKN